MAQQNTKQDDLVVVRIPILGNPTARSTTASKDQRFVNGYFIKHTNTVTGKDKYFFQKRCGYTQNTRPPGANATGRGVFSWKGDIYSIFDNKIYKGTTDLGVTLAGSSGLCGFAKVRPGATTQYLAVNDGTSLYLIATDAS